MIPAVLLKSIFVVAVLGGTDDIKIEIKDSGKGMCFKDEETCNGKWQLKGSKFKFSTEDNWLKMFVSQCKISDKCHEGNKEFDIERVVR